MTVEPADIEYGLSLLKARQGTDRLYDNYADGKFRLAFSTSEFRNAFGSLFRSFGYNRCRSVINALADRTTVTGWDVAGDGGDLLVTHANDIWARTRMKSRQHEVTKEAYRTGDAYVIVWPDDLPGPNQGNACIYPNRAHCITVVYDDEYPDRIEYAVKCWQVERGLFKGRWRVTTYDATQITRWMTTSASDKMPDKAGKLVEFNEDGDSIIANQYGVIPVIHFGNDADTGSFGTSELSDVIPLQDGLNKSVADMLVVGDFASYPQRWATGVEVEEDTQFNSADAADSPLKPGIDRVWRASNELAKFGQFDPADMDKFINAQDSWDAKIARVSSVPVHWLNQTNPSVSGESLKVAEAPYVSKVLDRQMLWSDPWAAVLRLALVIEGVSLQDDMLAALEPTWLNPESRSDSDFWKTAAIKIASGVPAQKVWAEFGYTQDEIKEMITMNDEHAAKVAARDAAAFADAYQSGQLDNNARQPATVQGG